MWCLRSASQKSSWAKLFLISEAAEVLRYLGQTLVPRNKLQHGKTEDLTPGSQGIMFSPHIIQSLFEGSFK